MPSRLHPQSDHYYHVFNRGVDRKTLFHDKQDYGFFIARLKKYSTEFEVDIIAYCIMPNHYHCLLHLYNLKNGNSLTKFMHRLHSSFAQYFNKRYKHSGYVFQGRYQCKNVNELKYLINLICYIHLNPVDAKLVVQIDDWQFSSHKQYSNLLENPLLKRCLFDGNYHEVLQDFISRREEKIAYIQSYLLD